MAGGWLAGVGEGRELVAAVVVVEEDEEEAGGRGK